MPGKGRRGKGQDPQREALERALELELGTTPAARSDFKQNVRERFLRPEIRSESVSRKGPESRSAPHAMIEDALRNLPPTPAARPEFRSALKAAFTEGQAAVRPVVARTGRVRSKRRQPQSFSSGPFSWQVVSGMVAIAAAVILMITVPDETGVDPVQTNWLVEARGTELEIDSVRLGTRDDLRLVKAVNGGHLLASLDGFVQLELEHRLRLAMEPASRLELPTSEKRAGQTERLAKGGALAEDLYFKLDVGTLHLMTGRQFGGQPIVIETPHAKVRIRGSVLSIRVFEGKGTCICVAQGEADVEVLSGDVGELRVEGNSTCFVFADQKAPALGNSSEFVDEDHLAPLLAFYDPTF